MYYNHYQKIFCTDIIYKINIKNLFNIPEITKIVLNTMHKNAITDKKYIIYNNFSLHNFSMQKLKYTCAHKSIASFKLRRAFIIGVKVDLRNLKMYNFLEKFIYIILPKIKDFNKINAKILCETHKCNSLTISVDMLYNFPELENYVSYFLYSKNTNITLVTNVKKNLKNSNSKNINYTRENNNMKNIPNIPQNMHVCYNKKILLLVSFFRIPFSSTQA